MSVSAKILHKKDLEGFLRRLAGEYTVFVPEEERGNVAFGRYRKNMFMSARYVNFTVPPAKCFLFPESIKKYIDQPFDEEWIEPGKKALFGVRPCDAHSFILLDRAVRDNDSYKKKRDEVLLIVIGCNSPGSTCFCTSVGGGPFSASGADIFMTDIGDRFVVEDVSGRAAVHLAFLDDAEAGALAGKERVVSTSLRLIAEGIDCGGLPEKLEGVNTRFEKDGTWERLGQHCTNCARCTAVCPTCHCCFVIEDVADIVCEEMGDKAKDFDPCMLNIAVTAGLDGRVPVGHQRVQRRIMDKFCRTMRTVGQPFCVGCGRCIEACVENVDITEILRFVIRFEGQCAGSGPSEKPLQI